MLVTRRTMRSRRRVAASPIFLMLCAAVVTPVLRAGAAGSTDPGVASACEEESFADPAVRAALSASSNVFFLHTSNETFLTDIQRCALASAVRLNPTRRVNFFSNVHSCAYLRAAVGAGVHLVRHDPRDVYLNAGFSTMVDWYATRVWDMHYSGVHLSDSMRLALLYAFGGVYLDSDVVSLRPLDGLVNTVGVEDPWMINNAVLALERGHAFAAQAGHEFVHGFSATWWGWNGPRLVTRVSRAYLGERRADDVLIAPVEEFYPISWRDWKDFFAPAPPGGAWLERFAHARVVHVWHSIVSARLAEMYAGGRSIDGLLLGRLLDAACPAESPGSRQGSQAGSAADLAVSSALQAGGSVEGLTAAPPPGEDADVALCGVEGPAPPPAVDEGWFGAGVVPTAIVSGGGFYVPKTPGAQTWGSGFSLRAVTAVDAGYVGACMPSACGVLRCGSCGIGGVAASVALPPDRRADGGGNRSAWTLTLWLSTLALDSTLRDWPHHTPAVPPSALPAEDLGVPDTIGLAPGVLPEAVAAALSDGADALVIGVEDGHLTAGSQGGEWLRSHSPVADGRWHHVAVIYEQAASPGTVRLSLALDGVLQAQRERPAASLAPHGFAAAVLGSAHVSARLGPSLFIDAIGVFPAALPHAALVRLRNAQLLVSARRSCLPTVGLPETPDAGAVLASEAANAVQLSARPRAKRSSGARLLVLVLSSLNDAGATARLVARQTWLQLSQGLDGTPVVRHLFCLGGADIAEAPPPVRLEAARFRDIIISGIPDAYERLAEKVMNCFSAAIARADADGAPFDFIVKTDHDVFLRADTLREELTWLLAGHGEPGAQRGTDGATPQPGNNGPLLYWRGFAYRNVPPLRDLRDKNADTNIALLSFPPYTAGVGYVLSAALVRRLAALKSPVLAFNEDQALGLWVMQAADEARRGGPGATGAAAALEALEPVHDIRFQQWDVCNDDQLAVHPSSRRRQRLLAYNVRSHAPMCLHDGSDSPPYLPSHCCLCCDCEGMDNAWFMCDAQGAWVPSFVSLSQLVGGNEWALLRSAPSASALAIAVTALATAPAAPHILSTRSIDLVTAATARAKGGQQRGSATADPLSCAWAAQGWGALGVGELERATATGVGDRTRGAAAVSLAGVRLSCRTPLPAAARYGQPPAPLPPPCGAWVDVIPPQLSADCLRPSPVLAVDKTLPSLTLPGAAADSVSQLTKLLQPPPLCYAGAPLSPAFSKPVRWLLVSAVVSTRGSSCELAGVNGTLRKSLVMPADGEDVSSTYPRWGASRAFCGLVADVIHTDGQVSRFRSPFARGSVRYVHYEVLPLQHAAPVHRVRVHLSVPSLPASVPSVARLQPVELFDLTVLPVDVPPERVQRPAPRSGWSWQELSDSVLLKKAPGRKRLTSQHLEALPQCSGEHVEGSSWQVWLLCVGGAVVVAAAAAYRASSVKRPRQRRPPVDRAAPAQWLQPVLRASGAARVLLQQWAVWLGAVLRRYLYAEKRRSRRGSDLVGGRE